MIDDRILHELKNIVGPADVRTDPDTIRKNSTDATKVFHPADVIVFPASALEVSEIVKLANRERIPIVSRGGGVGYAGGAVPVHGGIVISMIRMNRILEINPLDLVAVVEAGVITQDLHTAAEAKGLFYPPDPASSKQSTVGGNVAHNAGGPRAFKYGVTRQYVMGMEVVLPTGEIVSTGGRVVKNAVAYDLTNLMCGSEGTLGIMTRFTMRLLPKPEAALTLMALFRTVRQCAEAANHLIEEKIIPSKLELIDGQSLAAIRAYIKDEKIETSCELPEEANAILLVEVDGERKFAERQLSEVRSVLKRFAIDIQQAANAGDLWAIRRHMSPAVGRIRPNKINEDIVVPRSRVPDYLEAMEKLQEESRLPIACFGHVGDGNIHVNLMIDASKPEEQTMAETVKRRIFELAIQMGGTISGEHGIGITKAEFLPMALSGELIETMKKIKRALDPNNILNPGEDFLVNLNNLTLAPGLLETVVDHAKKCYPKEGCGLLVGFGSATRFIPMDNVLGSSTAYEMDPGQLINTLRDLRSTGEELVAIYHSHPATRARPSKSDIAHAYYPEAAYLIVSLADPERPEASAFRILDGEVLEIEVHAIV